jgi:uncharacterized protein YkwD
MKSGILALILVLAGIGVSINGEPLEFEGQEPVNIDGRVLVPVRAVFEALGFHVDWDYAAQAAVMTRGGDTIIINIGSEIFITNGVNYALDVAAQIIGGSTLVPIRLPLESVGFEVDWDEATQTVLIGFDDSAILIVNGILQDFEFTYIDGIPVVPIDFLTYFGIGLLPYNIPQIRDLYFNDLTMNIREGLTTLWIMEPRPEGGRQGHMSIRLDLPVFMQQSGLNDNSFYIPLSAAAAIIQAVNPEIDIDLSLPFRSNLVPGRENLRGRDAAELWAAYGALNPPELAALGFNVNDINYLYMRVTSLRTEAHNAMLQNHRNNMLAAAYNNPGGLPIVSGVPSTQIMQQWINAWPGPTPFERYTLQFINEYRLQNGLGPVEACPVLSALAWYRTSYLHHAGFVRQGLVQGAVHSWGSFTTHNIGGLARDLAVNTRYAGGNFHAMSAGLTAREQARRIVDGWINSVAHRNNMLREGHNIVGIGTALSVDGTRTYTYTFFGVRN